MKTIWNSAVLAQSDTVVVEGDDDSRVDSSGERDLVGTGDDGFGARGPAVFSPGLARAA